MSQEHSLTAPELRQILGQLNELGMTRAENAALKEYIERDREFDERERELAINLQKLADERLDLANQTIILHKEQAEMYQNLYRALIAKPSFGCRVVRVLTIGIHRCT